LSFCLVCFYLQVGTKKKEKIASLREDNHFVLRVRAGLGEKKVSSRPAWGLIPLFSGSSFFTAASLLGEGA
jgi:hypothetical protein